MMKQIFFLIFFCSLSVSCGEGHASEVLVYRGEQSLLEDTVWSGEILIDGILTVAAGVSLEIRPGTIVRFSRLDSNQDYIGEHEIFSQGTIRSLGTAENPVMFTSAESSPQPGDWGAVNMMVSDQENLLLHTIVEYGYRGFHAHFSRAKLDKSVFRNNLRGAQFQESQVSIHACRFLDNVNGIQFRDSQVLLEDSTISGSQWGLRCVYSDLKLFNNVIKNNLINGANIRDGKVDASGNEITENRRGLYLQRSRGQVVSNDLSFNSEHGIFLEDSQSDVVKNRLHGNGRSGVRWLNSQGRFRENLIDDNGVYGFINDDIQPVDARNNWWGTADFRQIAQIVRDGRDRDGLGAVSFDEFLTEPYPFQLLGE
jgi:hypothetical protein